MKIQLMVDTRTPVQFSLCSVGEAVGFS